MAFQKWMNKIMGSTLQGTLIKGEMSFCREHRGFASIFWIPVEEVHKVKELFGEPIDISKRLYMTDVRGWELNMVEYIVIIGIRVKARQTKLDNMEEE